MGNRNADVVVVQDKVGDTALYNKQAIADPQATLLKSMLSSASRSFEDVWVTLPVLCWGSDGKDPSVSEYKACSTRLHKELGIIQPRVIITLGATALKTVFPKTAPALTSVCGRMIEAPVPGAYVSYMVPVMPTYSLNHLLREQDRSLGGLWNKFFDHVNRATEVAEQLKQLENA